MTFTPHILRTVKEASPHASPADPNTGVLPSLFPNGSNTLAGYPVISLNTLKIVMGRETHLIADFLDRVFAAFQRFRPASIRT